MEKQSIMKQPDRTRIYYQISRQFNGERALETVLTNLIKAQR